MLYVWFPLILGGAVGMLMMRPARSSRLILGAVALYLLGWTVAQVVLAGTGGGGLG